MEKCHGRWEVGTLAGTCRSWESWRVWLARLGDDACPRCRDPVLPRGPAQRPPPRQESGIARVSRGVRGSSPAAAGCLERRAGPGGASFSVNAPLLSAPPAARCPAL